MKINREKIELLKDLSNLLEKDLITREEFERQKVLLLESERFLGRSLQGAALIFRLFTPQFVTLIAIILFYSPVSKLITNASEVAFGDNFSFKVQQALNLRDPALASVVKKLTKEEISTLLTVTSYRGLYSTITRSGSNNKPEIALDDRFDTYVNLQKKGLFYSSVGLKKIKDVFELKKASYESDSFDPFLGLSKQKYYPKELFSKEELSLLDQASGRLTTSGQKVYGLIVDNAAEELSKSQ